MTEESWTKESESTWKELLTKIINWVENHKQLTIKFDKKALKYFLDWRNKLFEIIDDLPDELHGVFPKIVSYAVRLAGIIHCINCLMESSEIKTEINLDGIKRGIKAAEFYLAHMIDSLYFLYNEGVKIGYTINNETKKFASILEKLENEVIKELLPIGLIADFYNKTFKEKITSRKIGEMIHNYGLTKSDKKHSTHGKKGVHCLIWDKNIDSFIKDVLNVNLDNQS